MATESQLAGLRQRWTKTVDERFNDKVDRSGDCWVWTGATNPAGYGRFWHKDRLVCAHRFSFERATGQPIPKGMQICHDCDNPPCVRPAHLFVGTRKDNMADMVRKGRDGPRIRPGAVNGRAKLTAEQARAIRQSHEARSTLAARFGVSLSTISRIRMGRGWKCLD